MEQKAREHLATIHEMVKALGHDDGEGDAIESIHESAQVSIRGGWYGPTNPHADPTQFELLLKGNCTRIIGRLNSELEPETVQLEYSAGNKWNRVKLTSEDIDALLAYAGCFYFGE